MQSGSPAVRRDRVARARVSRELLFEFRETRTQTELARAQHASDVLNFARADVRSRQRNSHAAPTLQSAVARLFPGAISCAFVIARFTGKSGTTSWMYFSSPSRS